MHAARIALLLLLLVPYQASATVYYHDTWYDGAQVALQLGNCPGECDAVVFQPDSYPFTVNYVYAIGGPANAQLSFDVMILDAGTQLYPDMDAYLGGADDVQIQIGNQQNGDWFEVDLAALGTPATITSGRFAVAFCFLQSNSPCNTWGLGSDTGPAVIPDGGMIWVDPIQACLAGMCIGGGGDYSWANLASWADRNWIIRASDTQWAPGNPTDDDDDAVDDDDAADDDAADDDDDAADDDAADDDDDADDDDVIANNVKVDAIEPGATTVGDQSTFIVSGEGFQDGADLYLGNLRVMPIDVEDAQTIEGAFPADLTEGYYNVCVENPDSSEDCLLNGLEVVAPSSCSGCSKTRSPVGATVGGLALLLLLAVRRRR